MILLRHGQSEFNLLFTQTKRDPGIVDPKLTPLGHEQAQAAAEALKGEKIRRIIASPYTRALETAAPIARALGLPVIVNPIVGPELHADFVVIQPTRRTLSTQARMFLERIESEVAHIHKRWDAAIKPTRKKSRA